MKPFYARVNGEVRIYAVKARNNERVLYSVRTPEPYSQFIDNCCMTPAAFDERTAKRVTPSAL